MHGIFNRGLQCFVRDIYGPEIWEQTCQKAELTFFNFETMLRYADGVTDRVILALCHVLDRSRDSLLEDFGTYVVSAEHMASFRRLLRFGGDTYEEFLHSLEDVYDRAKMAIPDLDVPRLRLTSDGDNQFTLHYRFAKQGFGSVFLGLLRGMADDYGALVLIEHRPQSGNSVDIDTFEITLAKPDVLDDIPEPEPLNRGQIDVATLRPEMLDILLPLHVHLQKPGVITHMGPTFAQLLTDTDIIGKNLFDIADFRRPLGLATWQELLEVTGQALTVQLRDLPDNNLRAVSVDLCAQDTLLMDFSLGAGVHDIVASKNLNRSRFSPADQTAEMLYLKEVQYIVLHNTIELSNRLDGAKKSAETQAYTDVLTGLPNRRALYGYIGRLQKNHSNRFAIFQIDLDFFKAVNDTHGHGAGDHVLKQVAEILRNETRATDMVARIGGDEFVLVLRDFTDAAHLEQVAQRIIEQVQQPIPFDRVNCKIGASIGGVIASQEQVVPIDILLEQADEALYQSKRSGRGLYHLAKKSYQMSQRGPQLTH